MNTRNSLTTSQIDALKDLLHRSLENVWRQDQGLSVYSHFNMCCKMYYGSECYRCPIQKATGKPFCRGTPLESDERGCLRVDKNTLIETVTFLKSTFPELESVTRCVESPWCRVDYSVCLEQHDIL